MGFSQQISAPSPGFVHSAVIPQVEHTYRLPSWTAMLALHERSKNYRKLRTYKYALYERRHRMAQQTGKRYVCKTCGVEIVVTRVGDGTIQCHGQPLELR